MITAASARILSTLIAATLPALAWQTLAAADSAAIDAATVKRWSAPYRGWHYYPDHVIPARPNIKGFEAVRMTDVPTVYQLPGRKRWFMTFIGFDGKGYQSFVAESADLIHWTRMRLAMGYGPKGSFDHGGVVLGAFLYEQYDVSFTGLTRARADTSCGPATKAWPGARTVSHGSGRKTSRYCRYIRRIAARGKRTASTNRGWLSMEAGTTTSTMPPTGLSNKSGWPSPTISSIGSATPAIR